MTKTYDNLAAAFAGESQANRKYLFFAEKAESEGQFQAARLFRAAAEAETVHARNHLRVMKGILTTLENLGAGSEGEHHEFTAMYPDFIKEAIAEGNKPAQSSFEWANKVEEIHYGLFEKTIAALKEGKAPAEHRYYVCQTCGNTVEDGAPERCPVCGAPSKQFKLVD